MLPATSRLALISPCSNWARSRSIAGKDGLPLPVAAFVEAPCRLVFQRRVVGRADLRRSSTFPQPGCRGLVVSAAVGLAEEGVDAPEVRLHLFLVERVVVALHALRLDAEEQLGHPRRDRHRVELALLDVIDCAGPSRPRSVRRDGGSRRSPRRCHSPCRSR